MEEYIIDVETYICAELGIDQLSENQYQLLFDNCGEYLELGCTTNDAAEQLIDRVREIV